MGHGHDASDQSDDPDFIGEEGNFGSAAGPLGFGVGTPGGFAPGLRGSPTPVFVPKTSTPLETEESGGAMPTFALWTMRYLQHGHLFSKASP
jgi:hypothetical protein